MSVQRNNTCNLQGNGQQQRTGCSPKMKKIAAVTSVVGGVASFVGAIAIGTKGFQENGTQAERLGAATLAMTGLTAMVTGAISLGRDALGYSGQTQPQTPQVSNNV